MINDLVIKQIEDEIREADNIALFTHTNCDCDGIGSMCALYEYLQQNNKNVSMFCDSDIPEKYNFIKNFEKINKEEFKNNFDLMVSLDTAISSRLGIYENDYLACKNSINIDHHECNPEYAKVNFVKPYSSCGEVLYEILKSLSDKISGDVATALFSAISADTNQFSNANVTSRTYFYAGELIDLKADSEKANNHLHKDKNLNQLKLAGFMATNLKIKKQVSYLLITLKDLKKLKVKSSDVSNFLTLISNVDDSKITLLIKERSKDNYRLNMRSIGEYNVNRVAGVFNGGGHKNAAGCNMKGSFKTILKKVLEECFIEINRNEGFEN